MTVRRRSRRPLTEFASRSPLHALGVWHLRVEQLATHILYYGDNLDIVRRYIPTPRSTWSSSTGLSTREVLGEGRKPQLPLLIPLTCQQAEQILTKTGAEQQQVSG